MSVGDIASKTFKTIIGMVMGIIASSLVLFGAFLVIIAVWAALVR